MDAVSLLAGALLYFSLINGKYCKQKRQIFNRHERPVPTLYPDATDPDPTIRNLQKKFDILLENVLKISPYEFSQSTQIFEHTSPMPKTTITRSSSHHDTIKTTPTTYTTSTEQTSTGFMSIINEPKLEITTNKVTSTSGSTSTLKFDISLLKYKRLLQEGDVEPYEQYTNKKAEDKINGGLRPNIQNSVLLKKQWKGPKLNKESEETLPDSMPTAREVRLKGDMSLKDIAKANIMRNKKQRVFQHSV